MKLSYEPPAGWRFPTIEEIAAPEKNAIRIGPFGSALKKHEYSDHGVRVLGIEDVLPNELISRKRKYIPEHKFRELSQYTVKPGDLLVTNMGTVGRTCVVPEDLEKSIISSHLIKVSLDIHAAWPPYISWMLNCCPLVVAQIRAKCQGAIMAGFNSSLLKQLRVPLPPMTEQRRIADVLDRAEALRAKRRTALDNLDTLAQSIFLDLFGDPATNPKGWPMSALEDLCSIGGQYGAGVSSRDYDPDLPRYVRITDITDRGDLTPQPVSPSGVGRDWEDHVLYPGDVLFARSGATVGKTYLHRESEGACVFAGYLIRFRPNPEKLLPETLFHYTQTAAYRSWVSARQRVVAQPNINAQQYGRELNILVPPLDLQRDFARRAAAVETLRAAHCGSLAKLDALFASLQHRAFRGEL